MRSLAAIILVGFLPLALARPQNPPSRVCGVEGVSDTLLAAHRGELASELDQLVRRNDSTEAEEPIAIDTYIHVISTSETADEHHSNETIQQQMKLLNEGFRPAKISFTLKSVNWNVKPYLALGKDNRRQNYLFHKGDNRHLNIYYAQRTYRRNAAFARTPDYVSNYTAILEDGVTLPLWVPYFDTQFTIVHEVGHWFGLLHTWGKKSGEGCTGDGDFVDDTPAHIGPSGNCRDTKRDTCPNIPGRDPIYNYMNYVDDGCYKNPEDPKDPGFTRGQINRMHQMWKRYRSQPVPIPDWPNELKRLEPIKKGGKMPYYPEPVNTKLTYLECLSSDDGNLGEIKEEICGSRSVCSVAAKKQEADATSPKHEAAYRDCMVKRISPLGSGPESVSAFVGVNSIN